jgi:hypothetical protein
MKRIESVFPEIIFRMRLCLLRVFRRFAWVERERFELGSLVNLYLGFNGNSDLQNRLIKLEALKGRTETVLRRYNVKAFNAFRELTFRVNNTRVFIEDLCNACGIVHRELIRAQNALYRLDTLRRLAHSLSGKTPR